MSALTATDFQVVRAIALGFFGILAFVAIAYMAVRALIEWR